MTEFYRFDRWDAYIGPIAGVVSAVHYQQAGGENSLTLTTMEKGLNKGDRVVWRDDQGFWREHIANEPKDSHADDGSVTYETYCEDALNEVFRDIVDDIRVRSGTADSALDKVLQRTRWSRGEVDVAGSHTKSFYHISAGEALQELVKTWGGELYSSFEANDNGITARKVNLVMGMGSRSTHKRFEYGKDLIGVTRTVAPDDVYTAMRGFGKGDDLGDDDGDTNGRRITFAGINGGRDYVEDEDALRRWGRPDGKGGRAHSFGTVVFQDCEDPKELMELTRKALDEAKAPKVSYECSVRDLTAQGRYWEGVAVGDDVQVVDTAFTPALRLEARVMAVRRNLADPSDVEVTIGNVRNTISDEISGIVSQIAGIGQQSSSWDAAVQLGSNYLNRVIETLNANFEQGGVYKYESFEQGTIYSSVPLDEGMRPTRRPASAFQLKGGGFRIASSVKADGSFNWRTFGTGDGFTADCLTAGVIRGGANYWDLETGDLLFRQGGIRDARGRTSWNLDTGEFVARNADISGKITAGSGTIGGFTIGSTSIANDTMTLASNGLRLERKGKEIGLIGTNGLKADDTKSGLNFDMEESGDYMTWAAKKESGSDVYSMFLAYAKRALPMEGGGSWGADMIHIARDVDMHNYVMRNAYIDPNTGGANGGISATIDFVQVLGVNSDGTISQWGSDARMVFKRGLLVDLKHYTK